jgi:predicted SAM-dependent methyltransferase
LSSHPKKRLPGGPGEPFPPRLHLGCANIAPPGWTNLDGSWNAWMAGHPVLRGLLRVFRMLPPGQLDIAWPGNIRVHDVRRGLPFPVGAFGAIYASHFLEHLHFEEARHLLRECFRVLQPGGFLRLVVPDLQLLVREYLEELDGQGLAPDCAADRLCRRLDMRAPQQGRGHLLYRVYSSVKDFHTHKWMYDGESLGRRMLEAGFVSVSRRAYLESDIAGIEEVERRERFDNHRGICLEGMKPLAQPAP